MKPNNLIYSFPHPFREVQGVGFPSAGRLLMGLLFALFFTINASAQEAYAVYTEDNTTLTFYYDDLKDTREGTTYIVPWSGTYPAWTSINSYINTVTFDESFSNYHELTSTRNMFANLKAMTTINHLEYLNTENVSDMSFMFNGCIYLRSIDITTFDMQNVVTTNCMFQSCESLCTIYAEDNLDMTNVESSTYMFWKCFSLMGGKGTQYDSSHDDKTYARVDEGTNKPGYFTNPHLVGAYAVYTPNNKTLSFYYDDQLYSHEGNRYSGYAKDWIDFKKSRPKDEVETVVFDDSFKDARPISTDYYFCGMNKLTNIVGIHNLNTTEVTNMSYMFYNCKLLESIDVSHFNTQNVTNMCSMFAYSCGLTSVDLSSFNTANVTDMCSMFEGCSGLTSLDLTNFNTANVTYMKSMFYQCSNLTELDVSSFDTGNVTTMTSMFRGCSKLTSLDLSSFNTSNVTHMSNMFDWCKALTSLDLSSFNTSNVTAMSEMFSGCSSLTALDLSNFNTEKNTSMYYMFYECNSLATLNLSGWNTANVKSMQNTFYHCRNLTKLDLSSFNTANVTSMFGMFEGCGSLQSILVGDNWSTAAVTNSNSEKMFSGCTSLMGGIGTTYDGNHVDKEYARIDGGEKSPGYLTDPDAPQAYTVYDAENTTLTFYYDKQRTSRGGELLRYGNRYPAWYDYRASVTSVVFDASFANARPTTTYSWFRMANLTSIIGIEYLNTSEVTNMRAMFMGCSELTSLDVSGFVTDKVTDMYGMFTGCFKVNSLDLSNFNTSEVTNMYGMFTSCLAIANLDLSSFNTLKVTDMDCMFESCSSLTSLDLSSFNTSNVTNMSSMFNGCTNLTTIFVDDSWSTASVTSSGNMFAGCTNLVGGMGTVYESSHVDKEYARVDNAPSSPGYFTDPNNIIDPNAPYAVILSDGKTLQFRHDGQRLTMPDLKTYSLNTGSNRPGWVVDGNNEAITNVVFLEEFASARPTSMHSWFEGMTELTRVWYMERLNTSEVTDMANLFKDCAKLTSDKFDISQFTTSKVTDMSHMFDGCVMLTAIDVSHFDTQNVTDMGRMFNSCIRLETLNVSGLNTAKVTDMSKMFYDCGGYNGSLGTLDVTSFDTRQVTDMNGMFYHISARVDVTGFDTQNVTDMHEMFKNVSAEALDLHNFNTAKVTNMSSMFELCYLLGTITVGEGWTVENVSSSENMFRVCSRLTGEKGTRYQDENPTDKTYAHIDGGTGNPGYLTDINGPYAALSQDGKTLTFYKDGQRLTRTEKTYSLSASLTAQPEWRTDGTNATIEGVVFDESFAEARPVMTQSWFAGMTNLTSLTGMENLNTSEVTGMSSMFNGCTSLTSLDLSHFNTSKVTSMTSMFNGCTGLTTLDLMTFDTGNTTSMSYLFYGCSNLTTIYVGGGWSTAKVDAEYSEHMFEGCTSLVGYRGTTYDANHVDKEYARLDGGADSPGYFSSTPAYAALSEDGKTLTFYCDMQRNSRPGKTYDLNEPGDDPEWYSDIADITTVVFDPSFAGARPVSTSNWFFDISTLSNIIGIEYLNTSEVTNMSNMFYECEGLTSIDLSHFDTGKVTDMNSMFSFCESLTSLDLSSFNTANVTDMSYTFSNCSSLKRLAVGDLNTGKVTNMSSMFEGCKSLTEIDFSGYGFMTTNVTDMNNMFSGCESLTTINTWRAFANGTQNVTNMEGMFRYCSSLETLDLTRMKAENVTNMSYMFDGCTSLTEISLSKNFTASNVTNMAYMFRGCTSLKSLDLSSFNTENLENMNRMFMNCQSLKQLDLSSFNTDKVKNKNMEWAFAQCTSLESIDVSSFNTSGLTSLWSMFFNCGSLKVLDLSSFDTKKVTVTTTMFQGCANLKAIYVGDGWDMSKATTSPGMFDGCTSLVGSKGTEYDASHVDKEYARLDGGADSPGYFSEKGDPYAVLSSDGKTLTFYCDGKRASHTEATYDLNEPGDDPEWYSDIADITTVVFDVSFAIARPVATSSWFYEMEDLTRIVGMENLNTKDVTDMSSMFFDCMSLTSLDLSHFDTGKVTNMAGMFKACGQLKSLDLSSFATRQVTGMSSMFFNCYSLKTVYVKEDYYYWETSNVKISENMFDGCISIVGGGGTTYDANNIDKAYAHIDGGASNPGYFTAKPAFLLGDVNGDGDVNVADVTALVNIVNNVQIENGQWIIENADVDGSGEVTSADVPALVNKILGK